LCWITLECSRRRPGESKGETAAETLFPKCFLRMSRSGGRSIEEVDCDANKLDILTLSNYQEIYSQIFYPGDVSPLPDWLA